MFWFGFEVSWAKLVLGRVVLFGLLALDALMQIRHAPRYGAGGFNVAHLPWLDALGPTRVPYELGELISAYLLVLVACGIATRVALPIAAGFYAWLYFGSQLDSYQHHYLVSLLLLLACFVPWERPHGARARTRVRTWALRLILVQVAVMYLWAAISKMNGAWIDGSALSQQLSGPIARLIEWKLPILGTRVGMATASKLVLATELALACTLWNPRAWRFAAPLGLALHLGILFSNLDIGLFAWLMLALYIFVVPDRVWIWLAERAPVRAAARGAARVGDHFRGNARWIVWALGGALAIALAAACRLEHALGAATALLALGAVGLIAARGLRRGPRLAWFGIANALAIALWLVVDRGSSVTVDYYRFWGGGSRQLGDPAGAERAYRTLTEVAPDNANGHYQLGRLLLARDASDQGLAQLHEAERLDPTRARAFVVEARWLERHHRRDEALAKARAAAQAQPSDASARRLLEILERSRRR